MKTFLLIIVIFFCSTQFSFSQEDGVVSLAIPVRSSLKFNRYVINPTFSFVREQNTYINITNKREWGQFEDAPQTYLINYSGRFRENIGVGVGLFQQNYGVLTTFGGLVNMAYNARLDTDSNLTFGLNLGFYKSSINDGKVVVNQPDPSLDNIPNNMVLSVSPGINYGLVFFDFGLSVNNLVQYNIKSSELLKEDPQQSVQAHLMYTGYLSSRGFFDESKFTTLIRSEFKKDQTIFSGIAMLTVPKGIWAQAGYNTVYGFTGGLGINITKQIAVEYNYEKAVGDLATFGASHEFTLAYKFESKDRYYYSGDDREEALLSPDKKKKPGLSNKAKMDAEERARVTEERAADKAAAIEEARLAAELRAQDRKDAQQQAIFDGEDKAQAQAAAAEAAAQAHAAEQARLAALAAAKAQADEEARLAALAATQAQKDEEARLAALAAAQAQADEEARLAAEAAAKAKTEIVKADAQVTQKDELSKSMFALTETNKESKMVQEELLNRLDEAIAIKDKDLKDLREENDLSEQGIYLEPKPFKSITAENRALAALQADLDRSMAERNKTIKELEELYIQRIKKGSNKDDATSKYYLETIQSIRAEQQQSEKIKARLVSTLETINVQTEIERRRRIKRAQFDNEKDRFLKDLAALERIKATTPLSNTPLTPEDFYFGEKQSGNVQILKGVQNVDTGFYMIIAVHDNAKDRDAFLEKVVSTGQNNINFFFDVNTSKYFIYYQKFDNLDEAMNKLQSKGDKAYNGNMSVVKIEN